jgi:translation initiation factor eIF-2B subunit alpha
MSAPQQQQVLQDTEDWVTDQFQKWISADTESSVAVYGIKALLEVIKKSKASTMMELQMDLDKAKKALERNCASLSLTSGAELFTRFVTRTSLDVPNFEACKQRVMQRGEHFLQLASQTRGKIASQLDHFIRDGSVILTHGYSRVVLVALLQAAKKHRRFSVIVTESRPDNDGYRTAARLAEASIPCTVVMDAGVGYEMAGVDLVMVGAEAVAESGGIINKLGTYQLSLVARALNKPFYVAAESFKFTRMYPLNQRDPALEAAASRFLRDKQLSRSSDGQLPAGVKLQIPALDYTPPSNISLLFTDLGVLTPSAVSDELIKLYY